MADDNPQDKRQETGEPEDDLAARFPLPPSGTGVPEVPRLKPKLPPHPSIPEPGAPKPGSYRKMAMASQAVSSLVTPIVMLSLLGVGIDKKFHTNPWGAFVGVMLGFIVGLNLLMNVLRRMGD